MAHFHSNALIGAGGQGVAEFKIDRSLRFNSGDSAYLNRTPSSAGNRRTFTFSCWVKRGSSGGFPVMFCGYGGDTNNFHHIRFRSTDELETRLKVGTTVLQLITSQVFRDFSSFYHVVLAYDSTQSTASNRAKLYVNGSQITDFSTETYPSQDQESFISNTGGHFIGQRGDSNLYFDGLMAEVHFVDGSALDPTSFGAYDNNGVWKAEAFSGTYGTNGFHLKFDDNSSNAALGTDSSGNSNTFTVNNLTADVSGLATAAKGFQVITYTGNGSSTRAHTSVGFQPDFVWIKCRSTGYHHRLFDVVRGFTTSQVLSSNLQDVSGSEVADSNGYVSAVSSSGFTTTADNSGGANVNANSQTYVAWCWKAGGTASSNNDGTVTSQVSVNTTYGFSIVTYTNPSSGTFTVGHGLGANVGMIITKHRNRSSDWYVWHKSFTSEDDYINLNTNAGKATAGDFWGTSTPGSSTFGGKIGISALGGDTDVAYVWSEVSGFSKFGSWTGNGSSNGPTVTLGFKPRYVLFKRTDASGDSWTIFDTERDSGTLNIGLEANSSAAEQTYSNRSILVSDTGFQVTSTGVSSNASGGTYIYAAFADRPEGEGIDSLIDTPTDYEADSGNNGGNYCTLNPLDRKSTVSLSNGNLDATTSTTGWAGVKGTMGVFSGKYYFEATANGPAAYYQFFGICASNVTPHTSGYLQDDSTERAKGMLLFCDNGQYQLDGNSRVSYSSSMTDGDVIAVAYDLDNNTVQFYKNGSALGSIDISSSPLASATVVPLVIRYNTNTTYHLNFGQRPFAYTPPTGYKSLCTQNLPDPTIADGSTAFDIDAYTGTGSTLERSNFSFSPDLVWIKNRSSTYEHLLFDTVRGATKYLKSNSRAYEQTNSSTLSSFDSDGFTLGGDNEINRSSYTYVAWSWDGGTSTVSNTDGSITSSVRASASNGFSIVKYVGTGANATVGHGLNAAPDWIIFKDINRNDEPWFVYHSVLGSSAYAFLNTAAAATTGQSDFMNSTDPTNSVFSLGNAIGKQNRNGSNFLALCWTAVEGFSRFGSYTGNGSADGTFIYTGFRPRWVMVKSSSNSNEHWLILDTKRDPYNLSEATMYANLSNSEYDAGALGIDILSNGFKPRGTNAGTNASGYTYIYAAFAEHPFKTARAR